LTFFHWCVRKEKRVFLHILRFGGWEKGKDKPHFSTAVGRGKKKKKKKKRKLALICGLLAKVSEKKKGGGKDSKVVNDAVVIRGKARASNR